MNTEFKISEYEVTYKNKSLPFGKSIEEWEKVFGKYDRVEGDNFEYYWDSLGVKLIIGESGKIPPPDDGRLTEEHKIIYKTDILYIYVKDMYGEDAYPTPRISISDKEQTYEEYKEYTIDYYKNAINYESAEVKSGMSLAEMNEKREEKGIPELYDYYEAQGSYVQLPRHNSGKKTNDDGMYKSNTERIKGKNYIYKLALYVKENLIEHIEIEANFENGKITNQ